MASPQTMKHGIAIPFGNSASGNIPKRIESRVSKTLNTDVHSTFTTIAKRWNQPKPVSTHDWISKIWYLHTMEYYSVLKRNKC
jgi:hypothetical protein